METSSEFLGLTKSFLHHVCPGNGVVDAVCAPRPIPSRDVSRGRMRLDPIEFGRPPKTSLSMNSQPPSQSDRRDFLTGRALRDQIELAGDQLAESCVTSEREFAVPAGGDTIRLGTRAMACDFGVILNPGPGEQVMDASRALDVVHVLEDQLSVYRPDSEMSRLNRRAYSEPVRVERGLFDLLRQCRRLCDATDGGFDPTSGPLIALWRRCRDEGRIPTPDETDDCRQRTGMQHVEFDEEAGTIRYHRDGVELNLGGIGKGYALDRVGNSLAGAGFGDWMLHGGYSSLLARGDHNRQGGWPVGIRNPLFTNQRLATLLLHDQAMSTSGSNVQYFRHDGRRYGHILDPRSGRSVEGMLSVTAVAPTAAEADALSTAFFVVGVEKTRDYCDNHEGVGAILIPPPRRGRRLEPILCGIPEEALFFTAETVNHTRG